MEEIDQTGVYIITTPSVNDRLYIGSAAQSFRRRWATHKNEFKKQKHHCKDLQKIHNEHNFDVLVVENVFNHSGETIHRHSLVSVVVIVIVVGESQWQAFDYGCRKFFRITIPLFLGVAIDELLVDFFSDLR